MAGPAGRLDAVLVCGGQWHDFDYARLQLLDELAQWEQVRTRVFENYAALDALERADLLVTYTNNVRPVATQQDALVNFVERGGRWLALHGTNGAIDPPDASSPVYRTPRAFGRVATVLGSQFLAHPPIAPYTVEITAPDHPLVAGIEPFETRDELYVSELHPPLEVLLHTRFTGESRGFAEGSTYRRRTPARALPAAIWRRHGLLFHPWSLPRPLRRAGPRPGGSRPARLRQLGGSGLSDGTRAMPALGGHRRIP